MAQAPRSPRSPKSPKAKAVVDDDAVTLQLQQFLDDWHYRIVSSSLARKWHRKKVVVAALDLLALNGVPLSPEEIQSMADLDEPALIANLVWKIPPEVRENFERLGLELQILIQSVTRMRKAVEDGLKTDEFEGIQAVMEENHESGLGQQVLKQAVVAAAVEVEQIQRCRNGWVSNMERRIVRLQTQTDNAEHMGQQLLAIESQLEQMGHGSKDKGKSMLMNMAESNTKTLLHSVFSSWLGVTLKERQEQTIRRKYQDQLAHAEHQLYEYKEKQLAGVRSVMMRNARSGDSGLLQQIVEVWKNMILEHKRDGDTMEKLHEMEQKLAKFQNDATANTKKVMGRMGADQDANLVNMAMQSWKKYIEDYNKDREFEDSVKKAEQAWQAHMAQKKDQATQVLDRMGNASDSGLLENCILHWLQYVEEEKKAREMDDKLNAAGGKFKSLNDRQAGNARGVQGRVNEQMKANLCLRVIMCWMLEAKVNRADKYYYAKMEGKRKQLSSVQTLFKSFAQQLEQGLGNVEGDSSGRRQSKREIKEKEKGLAKGGEGSVSLPDIHARQGVPA